MSKYKIINKFILNSSHNELMTSLHVKLEANQKIDLHMNNSFILADNIELDLQTKYLYSSLINVPIYKNLIYDL